MSYGTVLAQAKGDYTTAQTDTELVAAVSGASVKVAAVYVMSDTAGVVTFESDGSTVVFETYPGANGGLAFAAPAGQFLFETVAGESLEVTTDITGNHFVSLLYTIA